MVKKVIAPKKKRANKETDYVRKDDMMLEITKSKQQGKMTEQLGKMFLQLTRRYATVKRFVGYSYNDEMQGFALMTLCKVWKAFDETKYNNPFAYYTQVIHNAFFQFNNQERNQRKIRDAMLVKNGRNPSYNYTEQGGRSEDMDADGDSDFMEVYNESLAVLKSEENFDEEALLAADIKEALGAMNITEETTEIEVPSNDEEV